MLELFWCPLSGLVAGALVAAPLWFWVARRERARAAAYDRLARETWRYQGKDDA